MIYEILNAGDANSFYKATHSRIYPEMIKNTIFMFAVSKLLSKFHGGFRKDHPIRKVDDVNEIGGISYTFGKGGGH